MFETRHQTKSFTSGFKRFKSDKGHNISIHLDRILGPSTNVAGRKEKSIYIYILLKTAVVNVSSSENDDYKQFHIFKIQVLSYHRFY